MPGQHAFPKWERLTRRREYTAVFQHGRKRVGPEFICFSLRRDGQGRKMGFAVSRKVGNAVTRNRVKRYLREIYRVYRDDLSDDTHLVFVARPGAAKLDFHQCTQAVRRLLSEEAAFRG